MQKQASGGGIKTERFNALMQVNGLSVDDVAALLRRNIKTVYAWRIGDPYAIPDAMLELLELKLSQRSKGVGAA